MLTERHSLHQPREAVDTAKLAYGDHRTSRPSPPRLPASLGGRRTRSFSLDMNDEVGGCVLRGRHRISAAAAPSMRHFGLGYSLSVDISTATVPEDTELNCTSQGMYVPLHKVAVSKRLCNSLFPCSFTNFESTKFESTNFEGTKLESTKFKSTKLESTKFDKHKAPLVQPPLVHWYVSTHCGRSNWCCT
jgi:hypothetical protein